MAENSSIDLARSQQSFAALRYPRFRAYFLIATLAMMADNIEHVISYWVMYQKFHSQALGGFAVLSHWLPFLFFSVYSGTLADRFDPRRIIQLGMLFFMIASLGWGYFFITDTLEMWHAMVLLVIHGCAGVLWGPASQLLIHDIVGLQQLQSGVRLSATARWLGLLMGPAVGGAIMLALGPSPAILINVVFYLPLVLWLWKAPYTRRANKAVPTRAANGIANIVSTMRAIAANRTIVSMTLLAGCASLFVGNAYQAQMPEFAHDLGHGAADIAYSMLLAADAAGALIAGFVLESRGLLQARPRTAFILAMLWCCAIGGFAAAASYPLAFGLLFIAGFLQLAFNAMAQTLVQINAPAHIRGRVIGLYNMASLGLRAFSGVTVGLIGSLIGVHWSLALSAIALLAITVSLAAFTTRSASRSP
ncbi:MAG TPA: MFS transporter [Burkholderiales bacterium]|nr:MFS transporter [Burkholderiales bacterium]